MRGEESPNEQKGGVEVEVIGDPRIYTDSEDDEGEADFEEIQLGESKHEEPEERVTAKPPPPGKKDEYAVFYTRKSWKADPLKCPESIPKIKLPVTNMVVTWSETQPCTTVKECKERVREIQYTDINCNNLPDIRYHFLIGDDGSLYEGRGWEKRGEDYPPEVGPLADTLNKQHIEVAIIGRAQTEPTKLQMSVLSTVVTYGQEEDWITTCFGVYWRSGNNIQFYKMYDAADEMPTMLDDGPEGRLPS